MSAQLLFVEDEDSILQTLLRFFARRGYAVTGARSRSEALQLFRSDPPDLAVMDVMLDESEDTGGFEVCTELRESGFEQPIIFLSGCAGEDEQVRGFRCGADDYIRKPFSLPILHARIEAILRRTGPARQALATTRFGDMVIDLHRHRIAYHDVSVRLSRKECELLSYFLRHRRRPLSRAELLREVWGYHPELTTRTVDTHVLTLRKKLRDQRRPRRFIETLHNVGYQFIAE